MKINRKELKEQAKKQIVGNVWTYFGLMLVLGIIGSASVAVVVGPLLLYGAFSVGVAKFILDITRGKKGEFSTGFCGFNQFGSTLSAYLLQLIFISLWSFLFIIPGIIAAFRYSMTYFILADNPTMSGFQAIKKSKEMMIGHKWELCVLFLSFIGWYLLCAITFGLASIYVGPYLQTTVANFYEKIKTNSIHTETTIES